MNGSATWTPRRSLTVLLIALNFLAFVVWGVVFWNEFERFRSVAGWLAGAVAAVLAWIGIEQSRKHELGSVLDLPPTRLLVGAATVLNLTGIVLFGLLRWPLHRIVVEAPTLADGTQITVAFGLDESGRSFRLTSGRVELPRVIRGVHTLRVEAAGLLPVERTIELGLLDFVETLELVDLAPAEGELLVTAAPVDVQLVVQPIGEAGTPLRPRIVPGDTFRYPLPPGDYELTVSAEGYQTATDSARVPAGGQLLVSFLLEPIPPEVPLRGRLSFGPRVPDGLEVLLDGRIRGVTGNDLVLPPGSYRLEIRGRVGEELGYYLTTPISIGANRTVTVDTTLVPVRLPTISVRPPDLRAAEYHLDAPGNLAARGVAPTFPVFPGEHRVFRILGPDTLVSAPVQVRSGQSAPTVVTF